MAKKGVKGVMVEMEVNEWRKEKKWKEYTLQRKFTRGPGKKIRLNGLPNEDGERLRVWIDGFKLQIGLQG